MERVVLVDGSDCAIGTEDKLTAHRSGVLHRAFSIFVFDDSRNLLLQRRNQTKYHSGGLWANSCCGHPRPGESVHAAATRRLREEMGFLCDLQTLTSFRYRADVGDGLIEHEFDHILVGRFDGAPSPDPNEVEDWRWIRLSSLDDEISENSDRFAAWFPIALAELRPHLADHDRRHGP